jgi:hypothetical protein
LFGRPASIEIEAAIVDAAEIYADCAGVDTDDSGHFRIS